MEEGIIAVAAVRFEDLYDYLLAVKNKLLFQLYRFFSFLNSTSITAKIELRVLQSCKTY
jgi:hypothetical protein